MINFNVNSWEFDLFYVTILDKTAVPDKSRGLVVALQRKDLEIWNNYSSLEKAGMIKIAEVAFARYGIGENDAKNMVRFEYCYPNGRLNPGMWWNLGIKKPLDYYRKRDYLAFKITVPEDWEGRFEQELILEDSWLKRGTERE